MRLVALLFAMLIADPIFGACVDWYDANPQGFLRERSGTGLNAYELSLHASATSQTPQLPATLRCRAEAHKSLRTAGTCAGQSARL